MNFFAILAFSLLFEVNFASKCIYSESDVCDLRKHSQLMKDVENVQKQISNGKLDEKSCDVCRKAICLVQKCINSIAKWEYMSKWQCFSDYKYAECEQVGINFAPHLYFIMNNTKLTVDEICALLLYKNCAKDSQKLNWSIELPPKNRTDHKFEIKPKKILHISDLHYDPYYEPGSIVNCGGLVCCRKESKSRISTEPDGSAGYWGELWGRDPNRGICGAPLSIIESTLEYISGTHSVDLILWTGDNTRHLDKTSKEIILQTSQKLTELFEKYFGKTPIIVSLGNHEGIPNSQFAYVNYDKVDTFKIYKELADLWQYWFDEDNAIDTFLKGGFYSRTVDNIKIISLNTNLCATRNYWTLYDPIDPGSQLKWLTGELLQSEQSMQMVIIIGHFPAVFSHCIDLWIENYLKILDRFKDTIIGNFFAHSHRDGFNVYYSSDGQPISYALNAGSMVTHNPSYRIYTLQENGFLEDAETYFVNLTELNAIGRTANVIYKRMYSMKQDYGIKAVTSDELDKLFHRLSTDNDLLQAYFKNAGFRSVTLPKVCDENCKQRFVFKSIPVKSKLISKTNSAYKMDYLTSNLIAVFTTLTVTLHNFYIFKI